VFVLEKVNPSNHGSRGPYIKPWKPAVSAAGFVDRLDMRMCIKVFFDPDIHVYNESNDTASARHLWANFMSATEFVDHL